MCTSPLKILIAEYIPPFNKGELAILKGIMKSFEVLDQVDVSIFSLDPKNDRERYPKTVTALDVQRSLYLENLLSGQSLARHLFASFFSALQHFIFMFLCGVFGKKALKIMSNPLWRTYCNCDVVIICHDEVDCVNGVILKLSPIYIALLAKILKKPVVIYANGTTPHTNEVWIGRVHTRKLWRLLARYLLTLVDLITVRDEGSLHYYREISRRVPIYLTADPAFLLSPANPNKVKEIFLREKIDKNQRPLIGVAITREVLCEAYKNELSPAKVYAKSTMELANSFDQLIEKNDANIVFIPHSIESYRHRDDRVVAKDIFNLMSNKKSVQIITQEYSPEELKGFIGALDILISCRIHAAINAFSMYIPTCVITRPWDKRASNIVGKMLKQEKWILNVENLTGEQLFCLTTDLINSSNKIKKDLSSTITSVNKKALHNGILLKALLDSSKVTK